MQARTIADHRAQVDHDGRGAFPAIGLLSRPAGHCRAGPKRGNIERIHPREVTMRLKTLLLASCVALVRFAQAQAAALSGQVSSNEEGVMEGVLVSAKKDGATQTITVVSTDKGQFSFPADRLEP